MKLLSGLRSNSAMQDSSHLEQRLNEPTAAMALDLSGARPDAAAWRSFLVRLATIPYLSGWGCDRGLFF